MSDLERLFSNNSAWAAGIKEKDPQFFEKSAEGQAPEYLWVGCSDSRVSACQVTGMHPGEMFVHRNIANMVVHTDLNFLSVLQYAVDVLKVRHVVICGHYGCGGVATVVQDIRAGQVDNWLQHIRDTYTRYQDRFTDCEGVEGRVNLLCEINAAEQVYNLSRTSTVQDAWARGQELTLHGIIYDIKDGMLKDLGVCYSSPDDVPEPMNNPIMASSR